MYRVVLWDIDGTLMNFLESEKTAIRACFQAFQMGECSDEMLSVYSAINVKYWQALERGEMMKAQILVSRFRDFFDRFGLEVSLAEAFNREYQIRLGDTICFHEHALETVNALKGKVIQCAVTNGTQLAQRRKLAASGLDQIFEEIFISEEIGFEKPSVYFFDRVFEELKKYDGALLGETSIGAIGKKDILIVGDSLTSDIQGGNRAGIDTCLFNPKGLENKTDHRVDMEIRDLAEVIAIALGS